MTQARTNLGPLTTPFTYPSSCGVVVQACSTCSYGWQGQTCSDNSFNTLGVQDDLECWPPRSTPDSTNLVAVNGWGFYSPGIECPVGYATACAATGGVDGGFGFQFSILPSETVVGCCPSGFACKYTPGIDKGQTCYKYYSTGSLPTVQCEGGTSDKFAYVTVPATVTATITPTATGGFPSKTVGVLENILVYAPMIQINRQSNESSTSSTPTTPPSHGNTASPTPQPDPATPKSGGLSRGATIGIAVAAAIVGLALIAILFGVWMRRRRQRYPDAMPHPDTMPHPGAMPPVPINPYQTYQTYADKPQPHEMGMMYVAEAPTERDVHEADAMHKVGLLNPQSRHEMQG